MEKLTNTTSSKTSGLKGIILATALGLSTISCGGPTEKDIIKKQEQVETLAYQISHYIKARKDLVAKYNTLLAYPKTDTNKNEINKSLIQIREQICKYDKKIASLAKDNVNAETDLNNYTANLKVEVFPSEPIDSNKWDFLLSIQ